MTTHSPFEKPVICTVASTNVGRVSLRQSEHKLLDEVRHLQSCQKSKVLVDASVFEGWCGRVYARTEVWTTMGEAVEAAAV
jgi:hypothetical protein